ncbi:23S rRNA (guanosine(2251)-2'-O)-methyltransferase RlmB [candidate division KSB1 bacterium]|nr:23S rRNA (guanosine(2251)-2'-O)-methyltransferase RlmB [candidate division KSB1 bacterium]RQW05681.1 MAG: 23S rRNA (guanosine(2251)-2'-O)-methyltransferase RlmB [candidate division KSB1 bacterium]
MREKGEGKREKGFFAESDRADTHHNLIWGRKPILEWLKSGLAIKTIALSREAGGHIISDILSIAEQKKIGVKRLHPARLDHMTGTDKHQNIIAEVELPPYSTLTDIYDVAQRRQEAPLIAMLDGVQDPHNLGAILRSADAAGVHGIIIPKDKAVGLTPTVLKASAGTAAWVPVVPVTNLSRTIDELKKQGVWFTGAIDDADTPYTESDMTGPTVLILGSEGKGIRRLVREKCDFLIRIPMYGKVSSLNVSVAAGLLFFEARRQRGE